MKRIVAPGIRAVLCNCGSEMIDGTLDREVPDYVDTRVWKTSAAMGKRPRIGASHVRVDRPAMDAPAVQSSVRSVPHFSTMPIYPPDVPARGARLP